MIDTLVRASWQGALTCLFVAVLACLPGLSVSVRAWLWRLVPVKFLLALALSGAVALPLLGPAPLDAPLPNPEIPLLFESTDAPPPLTTDVVSAPLPDPSPAFSWETVVIGAYGLGVLVALLRLLRAAWQTHQWRAQTIPLTSAWLIKEATVLAQAMGLRHVPSLALSPTLASPAILGVFQPRIVLPEHLLTQPLARQTALAHELAHAQRRDLLWSALAAVAGVLFWFHPLFWLSRRELAVAQEMASDALALSVTATPPHTYGQTLLALSTPSLLPPLASGSASHLKRRLRALGHAARPRRRTALTALLLLSLVFIPWQLTHAQSPELKPLSGKTTGMVVDTKGKPIAGAQVRLVVAVPYSAKAIAEAKTDARGRFALSKAVPTATAPNGQAIPTGWLLAQAPGYGLATLIPHPDTPSRLVLTAPSTHEVIYQDTNGKPLVGLTVGAGSLTRQYFPLDWLPGMKGKTDSRGAFRVTGLPADGGAHFDLKDKTWVIRSTKNVDEDGIHRKRITLGVGLTITGTLRFSDGQPGKKLRVWCNPLGSKGMSASAFTDTNGSYTLTGLTPGDYRVCVETWGKDYTTVYKPRVTLGKTSLKNLDFVLSAGAVVTGRIATKAGKPLPGVWVGGGPLSGGRRDYTSYAVTDKQGRYRVRVPAGEVLLQLRNGSQVGTVVSNLPTAKLVATEGATLTQNFTVEGEVPQELSGTLLTEDNKPLVGATVAFASLPLQLATYTSSAQGRFLFRSLWREAKQTLAITKGERFALVTVPIAANQRIVVRWDNKAAVTLTGRVVDEQQQPLAQARVRLIQYLGNPRSGDGRTVLLTDATGRFTRKVHSLWRYRIEVEAPGYGSALSPAFFENQKLVEPIAVAPGKTHDFGTLVLYRASTVLTGKVVDLSGKPLAGIKVSVGSSHGRFRQGTTLADGNFAITELVREPLSVWISDPRYQATPIIVDPSSPQVILQARANTAPVALFLTSLPQARDLAQKRSLPLLIHFSSHACTQDRDLEARVFSDARVQSKLLNVVPVKLFIDAGRSTTPTQAQQNAAFYQSLHQGPMVSPWLALVMPNGKLLRSTDYNTARDPKAFAAWLKGEKP